MNKKLNPAEVKHTPTPWNVGPNGVDIRDSNDDNIATLNYGDGYEQAEIDSAFIVRAVNSHEELVAMLRGILTHPKYGAVIPSTEKIEILNLIAKAEGK